MAKIKYGEGSVFKNKRDKWVAKLSFTNADGSKKLKSFTNKNKKIVLEKLKDFKMLISKGEHSLDDTSLESYITYWLYNIKKLTLKATSFDRAECTINTHIIPQLGYFKMADITTELIQSELIGYMTSHKSKATGKFLSYSSIHKAYVYLNACFDYAVSNRRLLYNPCTAVVLPILKKEDVKKIRFFDDDEIEKFTNSALARTSKNNEFLYDYGQHFILLLYTGLRAGELLGLEWKNVDLEKDRIFIEKQVLMILDRNDINENGRPVRKPTLVNSTKTGKTRYVPLSATTYMILDELKEKMESNEDFVISNSRRLVSSVNLEKTFTNICKRAKIEKPLGLHTLRHTFASLLIRRGVDIKTVSEILGHKDVAFTYNTYVHLLDEQKNFAIDLLDKI